MNFFFPLTQRLIFVFRLSWWKSAAHGCSWRAWWIEAVEFKSKSNICVFFLKFLYKNKEEWILNAKYSNLCMSKYSAVLRNILKLIVWKIVYTSTLTLTFALKNKFGISIFQSGWKAKLNCFIHLIFTNFLKHYKDDYVKTYLEMWVDKSVTS